VPLVQPLSQGRDLVLELPILQGLVDDEAKMNGIDRFCQVVEGTQLHRLDGRVDRRVPRDDEHRDRQAPLTDLADQVEPPDPRQAEVGHDE